MNPPVRRFLPLCVVLLVATARCSCLTASSSSGTCEGRVGDMEISGEIDPESEHHTVYVDPSGNRVSRTVLNLSCAKGKLKVTSTLDRLTAFGGRYFLPSKGGTGSCPPAAGDGGTSDAGTSDGGTSDAGTSDGGTGSCRPSGEPSDTRPVLSWEVLTPGVTPVLAAGIISGTLKLDESVDGTVKLEFVDGSGVSIRYNAYHEDSLDVGEPVSSGGGSGDSDSD